MPGGAPPEPTIAQAPDDFRVGEAYAAKGDTTDPDGAGFDLSWEVVQVHNEDHEHPPKQGVGGDSVDSSGPRPRASSLRSLRRTTPSSA